MRWRRSGPLPGQSRGQMTYKGETGPVVLAPYLLPQLLALKNGEDGSSLLKGWEERTYLYDVSGQEN